MFWYARNAYFDYIIIFNSALSFFHSFIPLPHSLIVIFFKKCHKIIHIAWQLSTLCKHSMYLCKKVFKIHFCTLEFMNFMYTYASMHEFFRLKHIWNSSYTTVCTAWNHYDRFVLFCVCYAFRSSSVCPFQCLQSWTAVHTLTDGST